MADTSTTGLSYVVRTASSDAALGSVVRDSGRAEDLSDELYHQLRQLRKGSTFRLQGQFVQEHTKEAARKRLRAECGRDFVPCAHGYKVVHAVELESMFRRDAK